MKILHQLPTPHHGLPHEALRSFYYRWTIAAAAAQLRKYLQNYVRMVVRNNPDLEVKLCVYFLVDKSEMMWYGVHRKMDHVFLEMDWTYLSSIHTCDLRASECIWYYSMTFLNYTWYYCLKMCCCAREWELSGTVKLGKVFSHRFSMVWPFTVVLCVYGSVIMPIANEHVWMCQCGECMFKWLFSLLQQIRPEFKWKQWTKVCHCYWVQYMWRFFLWFMFSYLEPNISLRNDMKLML